MDSDDASRSSDEARIDATVERKHPSLPRFLVVPGDAVASWGLEQTTVVEVELDGTPIGRRSLKRWPDRDGWFFDLTEAQARKGRVDTGDAVRVSLRLASTALPRELSALLASDARARATWDALTEARRRMLAEHVRSARRAATRRRRAEGALRSRHG